MTAAHLGLSVPLLLEETAGLPRVNEPVTVGIPLPRGAVMTPADCGLLDQTSQRHPVQTYPLARWSDGSVQWVLLDFLANVGAYEHAVWHLQLGAKGVCDAPQSVSIQQSAAAVVVDTGAGVFVLPTRVCKPFGRIMMDGTEVLSGAGSQLLLTDATGIVYEPYIHTIAVDPTGPVRATVTLQGEWRASQATACGYFLARLSFYAGSRLVEFQVTLHNPHAAHHPGGLWDLGDGGSIHFKDFSFYIPWRSQQGQRIAWTADPSQPCAALDAAHLEIYQDSSGGNRWDIQNHVNRAGVVPQTFRGYRVTADGGMIQAGDRATPVLTVYNGTASIAVAIDQFWQNFPKALEVSPHQVVLRLFPQQYNDLYELQGGEQKRQVIYLQFAGQAAPPADLRWVHERLRVRTTPAWYANSQAVQYLTPGQLERHAAYQDLVETAITGPQSFFARRESIDEYGWRHFGDLYADHEAVNANGTTPLVSHYNNQYDAIYGALVQYLRSGDARWFVLMRDLARHVIDIDIYHTREDRQTYNHGLFWHTDHYVDAATATHRTYSKSTMAAKSLSHYGGGPSNEHNYTTGLLYYHLLTGDPAAREAVCGLADWVLNMDNGAWRRLGWLDRRPTGHSSRTVQANYHGPGRGAGNSINALLDAWLLTKAPHYLGKAEALIRRCIHPRDDIAARHLEDVEHRWSYTVFLQVLGKYLDLKAESGQVDYMYSYAQASLLHYAAWMLAHEVPYTQVLHKVEIPTETWPAQDIRKSNVLNFAAKHAPEALRTTYLQRADDFFRASIADLLSFETCRLTRPLVLLMSNGYMQSYFTCYPTESAPRPLPAYDFGEPQHFRPQFYEIYGVLRILQYMARSARKIRQLVQGLRCSG